MAKNCSIPQFKPSSMIQPGNIVALIGKRGSGKGFALKALLYELRKQHSVVLLFSGSEAEDPAFEGVIPAAFMYDGFDAGALKRIIQAQKKRIKEAGKGVHTSLCIVLDDVWEESRAIAADKSVQQLFFAGRHANISMFCLLQYAKNIPPALRTNVDWVGCFADPNTSNVKMLHSDYGGVVGSFQNFQTLFRSLTEDFQCMFIKTSKTQSSQLDQNIAWFRAVSPPVFKLGALETWEFDRRFSVRNNQVKAQQWKQITL